MRRIFLLLLAPLLADPSVYAQATIPFVGCPSEGMSGPVAASHHGAMRLRVAPQHAAKLAYYSAVQGVSTLAPRGWHCLNIYGSDGAFLVISPQPVDAENIVAALQSNKLAGSMVLFTFTNGFTSGRDEVAPVILRVFPAHKRFADDAATEFDRPRPKFLGPFKTDQLRYLSNEAVEFTTPAGMKGIGTIQSHFAPDQNAIMGVHILVREGQDCCDLISVAIHLPPADANLAWAIMHQVELEAMPSLRRRRSVR